MSDCGSDGASQDDPNTVGVGIGDLGSDELSAVELDNDFDNLWRDAEDVEGLFHHGVSARADVVRPVLQPMLCPSDSLVSPAVACSLVASAVELSEDEDVMSVQQDFSGNDVSDSDDSSSASGSAGSESGSSAS